MLGNFYKLAHNLVSFLSAFFLFTIEFVHIIFNIKEEDIF